MLMDAGMDTGPMLKQQRVVIKPGITYGELEEELSQVGAEILVETIPGYLQGTLSPVPQPEEGVTKAGLIRKEEGLLDFDRTTQDLVNQIHAFNPWPSAYLEGKTLKVHRAHAVYENAIDGTPGQHAVIEGSACSALRRWLVIAG
jgi:methionyl-tRNA formyltransferase